jgi:hypothetical protein
VTKPDIRGIGLCLVGPLMTMWVGSHHGPGADPFHFGNHEGPQAKHVEDWASWRRARAKR